MALPEVDQMKALLGRYGHLEQGQWPSAYLAWKHTVLEVESPASRMNLEKRLRSVKARKAALVEQYKQRRAMH